MKRLLLLLGIATFSGWAFGAITPTANQTCLQNASATLTCTASLVIGSGDAVVLYIGYPSATLTTQSVSDTCSNTWTHQTGAGGVQGANTLDAWTTVNATAGTCSITVTRSSGSFKFDWVAEDYSGVGSIGNVNEAGHTSSTSTSIALTTQDNNNFVVAGFALAAAATTCTATSGATLRGQIASTANVLCMTDNTSASPASVTNGVSYSAGSAGVNGAVELRATGSTGRAALDSDSGSIVTMNEGSSANYTLPSSPATAFVHNKSNWNTTVYALGAQTYKIVPQSPATLTVCGTTSTSLTIPQGQSLKIWTDGTNYFAYPCPILAGSGLTITQSSSGATYAEDLTKVHTYANTVGINSDSSSITATTAGTATTIFTFPTLTANTNYSFICEGTTTQATAGAGIGIAITAGTNAPTHLEAHATVATSATASAFSSSGDITSTTATAIYTGSAGTLTTQLPWKIAGRIQIGASVPTVTIGFFSANASDAVVVKANSYCSILP